MTSSFNSFNLTTREIQVLKLLVKGLNNNEIAKELKISEHTSKAHVSSILNKLHVTTRLQAAIVAVKKRIVE